MHAHRVGIHHKRSGRRTQFHYAKRLLNPTEQQTYGDARYGTESGNKAAFEKERRMQEALLAIKQRYGMNAILKGLNFEEGATAKERNAQIGGHKA